MAQCARNLVAVLECGFRHDYGWQHPGIVARGRLSVHRNLVRQWLAGGGPRFFPDRRAALHPGALVTCLVDDRAGLVRLAAAARGPAVVEGDADGQLVVGGLADAQGQFPAAATWQIAECRGRATALCVADPWAVLCGQGGHRDHARHAD
ncbi:hypothetical protein D9M71_707590 [compost metagenome]